MNTRIVCKTAVSAAFAMTLAGSFSLASADQIPLPTASYYGNAQMLDGREKLTDIEVRASGSKLRYDLPAAFMDEGYPMAMVIDYSADKMMLFPVGDSVPADERIAMQMTLEGGGPEQGYNPAMPDQGMFTGSATYAGETCNIYAITHVSATGAIETQSACVTTDGILLHSREGSAEQVSFEMLELRRGAQPSALFAVPAGYQVMDMSSFGMMMGGEDGSSPFDQIIDGAMDEAKDETTRQTRKEVRGLVRGLFGN